MEELLAIAAFNRMKEISSEELSGLYLCPIITREGLEPKDFKDKKLPDGFVKFCINDIENNIDKARQNAQLVSGDQLFKGDICNPNSTVRVYAWPLVVRSNLGSIDKDDIVEMISSALERFHWKSTEICQFLKIELDKKYGCIWHVVAGEEFGSEVTYEEGGMLYAYYGSLAILVWRCGSQLLKEAKYNELNGDSEIAKRNKEYKRRKSIFMGRNT